MNENLRTVKKKQDNEWITVRLSDIEAAHGIKRNK